MPISHIKNTVLRRVVFVVALPLIVVWAAAIGLAGAIEAVADDWPKMHEALTDAWHGRSD